MTSATTSSHVGTEGASRDSTVSFQSETVVAGAPAEFGLMGKDRKMVWRAGGEPSADGLLVTLCERGLKNLRAVDITGNY